MRALGALVRSAPIRGRPAHPVSGPLVMLRKNLRFLRLRPPIGGRRLIAFSDHESASASSFQWVTENSFSVSIYAPWARWFGRPLKGADLRALFRARGDAQQKLHTQLLRLLAAIAARRLISFFMRKTASASSFWPGAKFAHFEQI